MDNFCDAWRQGVEVHYGALLHEVWRLSARRVQRARHTRNLRKRTWGGGSRAVAVFKALTLDAGRLTLGTGCFDAQRSTVAGLKQTQQPGGGRGAEVVACASAAAAWLSTLGRWSMG